MVDVTVIILTFNEEVHIARAIGSVAGFAKHIVVVDSYSTDATTSIAASLGATVLQHAFVNQAQQLQWALDNASICTEWIMRLDADEYIEDDLAAKISQRLPRVTSDVVGVNLDRKHIFLGSWVRFGGRYPVRLLRLWRRGHGRIENRWMDEHVVVSGGRTILFRGGFADHNLFDLSSFTSKHNKYATREAIDVLGKRLKLFTQEDVLSIGGSSLQATLKRQVKERIYNRLPFALGALMYFVWRYIFLLGFLDGRSGLIYHFLQGFWYRFLVGAKVAELEKAVAGLEDRQLILRELSRLTGHCLSDTLSPSPINQE